MTYQGNDFPVRKYESRFFEARFREKPAERNNGNQVADYNKDVDLLKLEFHEIPFIMPDSKVDIRAAHRTGRLLIRRVGLHNVEVSLLLLQ